MGRDAWEVCCVGQRPIAVQGICVIAGISEGHTIITTDKEIIRILSRENELEIY